MHIPDTGARGCSSFNRYYFAQVGLEGLVVDDLPERFAFKERIVLTEERRETPHDASTWSGDGFPLRNPLWSSHLTHKLVAKIVQCREPNEGTGRAAVAGKAPRHRWHSRQSWQCGICNLQKQTVLTGSNPTLSANLRCARSECLANVVPP